MIDALVMNFPVSGVRTSILVPPLVAMIVSSFTSMAGVSGAFILLPFQMSVLGFTSPAVSSTNFVYNIVSIPSGVYRYFKEGRMFWPLTWIVSAGTPPGVFLGYFIRTIYLPDPRAFKLFVGCVLLYIGGRLAREVFGSSRSTGADKELDRKFAERQAYKKSGQLSRGLSALPAEAIVKTTRFDPLRVEYEFWGERFGFSVPLMFLLAFAVGIIGGTYGIGGGAIIAPFCVAVFGLPVYTVAGAALFGTFLTSIAGVFFYSILPAQAGMATSPDWVLGGLFGAGGFIGMYIGARLQKHFPQRFIKAMLAVIIVSMALRYIMQYFF